MAFAATVVWEVRTTGSDTDNGGGFDPTSGTPGTDYSQQDSAQVTYTDLVIDGTTNTKCTSAGNPFTSAHVGNIINITSGTGFTVQRVQVMSVAAGVATCDKSLGTLSSTGGNGKLGGALGSPGLAGGLHVGGNTIWVKSGSYSITSASTNISGGCVVMKNGASNRITAMFGYSSTRGDQGRPTLTASGITSFTVIAQTGTGTFAYDIIVDCANLTSGRGFGVSSAYSRTVRCKCLNAKNNGFNSNNSSVFFQCEAVGCSSQYAFQGGIMMYCLANACTGGGFLWSDNGSVHYCIAYNTTGVGFRAGTKAAIGCIAIGGSSDGFQAHTLAPTESCQFINCIAVNNSGYGFTATTTGASIYALVELYGCAGYNNTSGNYFITNPIITTNIGFVALSGDPFVASGSLDYRLNNTAGAGAALRNAGWSGLSGIPSLALSTATPDIGPLQARPNMFMSTGMQGGLNG